MYYSDSATDHQCNKLAEGSVTAVKRVGSGVVDDRLRELVVALGSLQPMLAYARGLRDELVGRLGEGNHVVEGLVVTVDAEGRILIAQSTSSKKAS
jgi:hypothetical protein